MKSNFNKTVLAPVNGELKHRPVRRKVSNHARCNLCDRVFRAASSFHRFCKACRSEDELFKFAEWLPQY
jgi:hypothetical protein